VRTAGNLPGGAFSSRDQASPRRCGYSRPFTWHGSIWISPHIWLHTTPTSPLFLMSSPLLLLVDEPFLVVVSAKRAWHKRVWGLSPAQDRDHRCPRQGPPLERRRDLLRTPCPIRQSLHRILYALLPFISPLRNPQSNASKSLPVAAYSPCYDGESTIETLTRQWKHMQAA
jgi:hypothetical protein